MAAVSGEHRHGAVRLIKLDHMQRIIDIMALSITLWPSKLVKMPVKMSIARGPRP